MVCMAGTVQVKGKFKFSVSKMVTGGEMAESYFAGPGELVLAPEIWGDIVPITVCEELLSSFSFNHQHRFNQTQAGPAERMPFLLALQVSNALLNLKASAKHFVSPYIF